MYLNELGKREGNTPLVSVAIFISMVATFKLWIYFFGEDELFATAGFLGTWILAPMCVIAAILLIGYLFYYFLWHVPEKIITFFKKIK